MKKVLSITAVVLLASALHAQVPADTLSMTERIEELNAVTVKAQRITKKGDTYRVVPDSTDIAVSTKAIDVLSLLPLPGLRVDRALQSIIVDGGSPILKVNGKEVDAKRLINIDPDTIKRIEYSNTPGLRYLDRGATGVINIVLKNSDDGGSVNLDTQTDPRFMMNDVWLNASYHKKKSEFSLQYNLNKRHYRHGPCQEEDSYIAPERTVVRKTELDIPVKYAMNDFWGTYTYQHDDSTMFIATAHTLLFDAHNFGEGTINRTDRGITSDLNTGRDYLRKQVEPKLDLFFTHKMAKGQTIELNAVGEYNISDESTTLTYTSADSKEVYPTVVYNNGWALSAEAVYSKQFEKIGTRWGVQYQHNYAKNDYRAVNVLSKMTKDNTYVFGQASGPIGNKADWNLGTGAKIFAVTEGNASRTYVRNLSTAMLNWKAGSRWNFSAEVRYTPSLPSLGDLSTVFQRTDEVEAVQGNATLKPSQTLNNRINIRYAAKNGWYANVQGGYVHTFGAIISTFAYDKATDLFVCRPQNSDFHNSLYIYGEAGVKNLWEHINIALDAKLKREQSKGEGFHHINDNFSLNLDFQTVWNKFILGCNFNLKPEWTLDGEYLDQSERAQNIYASYNWKNLALRLIWQCPFNPKGYSYEFMSMSETHPLKHINWTSDNGNMISLGLSWNFEFGTSFKKGSKTLQNGGYDSGSVL